MKRILGDFRIFTALLLVILFSASGGAQTRGTISGYVRDTSGAVLPGASVTLIHQETGAKRDVTANPDGFYQILGLTSGSYTLEAEAKGFKRYSSPGIELTVDQNVRADIQMNLGAVAESVEVKAAAALVDTRSATVSGLVDDRRMVDLPLYTRNVISFATLLPGVTFVSAPANSQVTDSRNGPTVSVNGGRTNQTYETLNGTYFVNPSRNTGLNAPPPDAVQEFRIKTVNYSAEEGRNSGAIISVVTRSGSNQLHGTAWEFHRNSALNARSFFDSQKPVGHQNQFGAAAGGPAKKDKIFWFGAYEGLFDRRAASTVDAFPPTAAERAGDFSSVSTALKNPFANNAPFPNNQIPVSSFDPAAVKLLSFLPLPPANGRLTAVGPAPVDAHLFLGRTDWTISEKQTFFVHYYFNQTKTDGQDLQFGTNIPGWMGAQLPVRNQNVGFNHTYVFSPSLLNQATVGFTRSYSARAPSVNRPNSALDINLPDYAQGGGTQFSVSGRFTLGDSGPGTRASNDYDFNDSLTWNKGRHTMKFGFQVLRLSYDQQFLFPPTFSFNGTRSGNTMADFLLGAYRSVSINFGVTTNDDTMNFVAGFAQDEFKVTSRLTLTYGLRYELPTPWVDANNRLTGVDPRLGAQSKVVPNAPPGLLFVGDVPSGIYHADKKNFAPRFGFAWDMFGNGKSAVRGAYGIFYDTINADSTAQQNPPFSGTTTLFNGLLSNPVGGGTPPPVVPDAKNFQFVYPLSGLYTPLALRTPYVQDWNFTFEQQLGKDISIQASYVGKNAQRLVAYRPFDAAIFQPGVDANGNPLSTLGNATQRVPFLPGIWAPTAAVLSDSFKQFYESAQFSINKRFSNNFTVLGSYTLGKSIDNSGTNNLGPTIPNPYNLNADRGRSDYDSRHTVAISWLYTFMPSRQGLVGRIFGGWTFSAIHAIHSGFPLTFFTGDDVALDGTGEGAQHPDLVGNPALGHASRNDMVAAFFNRAAFALPQTGSYGSAGRGILSGPGFSNTDFAAAKDFRVRENGRFQFRGEFFNIFNEVNFTTVRTTMTDPHFGQISGAGPGRNIQFGVKYLW
jgi:hypothetical protein